MNNQTEDRRVTRPNGPGPRALVRSLGLLLALIALVGCNAGATPAVAPTQPASAAASEPTAAPPAAGATPEAITTGAPEPRADMTTTVAPADNAATTAGGAAPAAVQPVTISGTFTYTNDIITTYYTEHAVALLDMHGFVIRDERWELPVQSQTLGFLDLDPAQRRGTFRLDLPAEPRGTLSDVDHDGEQDTGVQIFAVGYSPNLAGGPFSEGDDRSRGWPSYLVSTVNDAENNDEVIGGKLIVWAPDAQQQFPTSFGADGKLFTDDDPIGPVPVGYSVIDLDTQPFGVSQEKEPQWTLNEPKDAVLKDFSNLSYTEAFQQMFERVRREYAFNGIAGKEPNWDALLAELQPRVAEAEQKQDAKAFYLALQDFTFAFKDGHVGLGGEQFAQEVFTEQAQNGYGFALRELDDGRFIVVYVTEGGPAEQAGITVGAEVTMFDGKPIGEAVSGVKPLSGPFSTDFALRYQQVRYLLRAPNDSTASVTFKNPNEAVKDVTLTAVEETESFGATSLYRGFQPSTLPVDSLVLDSGVGYIRITSNNDDLNLIIRLFERALKLFEDNGVQGLIIDMRQNGGGAPLGLAGFLHDQPITLGQLQYFSENTGKFENEGPPATIEPNQERYDFAKMALLVDQTCFSACEIESYGFSQVPGMIVVGQYPTGGVEAEVARGQFNLPEGIALQVPTGRFLLPDGSLFLEGEGVQPTMRIPINEETVLSDTDVVLEAAEQAVAPTP